ncbi:hypothetical protein [Streptomyces sp. cmx-18-6]|uniref:hypothetical protein n=1 Tax=Streptomyces sp. cmx-18-6 TaxID=2790930 RepID=UPI003981918A
MHEGSIPLEDFLDTMNRLQADFERRLGSIERKAPPTPSPHAPAPEHADASAWTQEDGYHPLGIEAIWTTARESPAEPPNRPQKRSSPHYWGTPAD